MALQLDGTAQSGSGAITNYSLVGGAPAGWDISAMEVRFEDLGTDDAHVYLTGIEYGITQLSSVATGDFSLAATWDNPPQTPDEFTETHVLGTHTVTVASAGQEAYLLDIQSGGAAVVSDPGDLTAYLVDVKSGGALTVQTGGELYAEVLNTAGTTMFETGSLGAITELNVTGGTTTMATPTIEKIDVSAGELNAAGITAADLSIGAAGVVNTSAAVSAENFDLAGTLNRSGAGADRNITVADTLNLESSLDMTGGGTLTTTAATVNVAGGASLKMNHTLAAAEINVAGTVEMQGANVAATGKVELDGATLKTSGTVNVTGDSVDIKNKPNLNVTGGHLTIPSVAPALPLVFDFESGDLTGWTVVPTGAAGNDDTAFEPGRNPNSRENRQQHGSWFVSTRNLSNPNSDWDNYEGIIETYSFIIADQGGGEQINFLIGGGNGEFPGGGDPDSIPNNVCAVTLERQVSPGDWEMIYTRDGNNNWNMWQSSWDTSPYVGDTMRIRIYDTREGSWGFTEADYFQVSSAYVVGLGAFGDLTMAAGSQLTLEGDGGPGTGEAAFDSIVAGHGATIHGGVTAAGTLAPGTSPGTLNIDGNFAMGEGATYQWDHDGTTGDLVAVSGTNGDLDVGADWNLELNLAGYVAVGSHDLMTYTGALSGGGSPMTNVTITASAQGVYGDLYDFGSSTVGSDGDSVFLTLAGAAGITGVVEWVSTTGTEWNVSGSGHWDADIVPTATIAAIVNTDDRVATVTAAMGTQHAHTLIIDGGDVHVNGGDLQVENSTHVVDGSLTVNSQFGAKKLNVAGGTVNLSGASTNVEVEELAVSSGQVNTAADANVTITNKMTLESGTATEYKIDGAPSFAAGGTITPAAAGRLVLDGGTLTIAPPSEGTGEMPTGAVLWLDANDIQGNGTATVNGVPVTNWTDKSGAAHLEPTVAIPRRSYSPTERSATWPPSVSTATTGSRRTSTSTPARGRT